MSSLITRWFKGMAVSCGAVGVLLQFVDFEVVYVDIHGDLTS